MTLSSKVAVLEQGLVQQLDSPYSIYARPANLFVAGFVGSPQMNLLKLECVGNTASLGKAKIPLPQLPCPPQMVLGIRPEDLRLAEKNTLAINGKVQLVEEMGREKLVSVKVENSDLTLRALLPSEASWEKEEISLALPEERLHWFDEKRAIALIKVRKHSYKVHVFFV